MKIYWVYDWLTISRAEINGFQAKGGGVYASLPMLAVHHGSTVSQGKHRDFEGYAAYFHSFQLQCIQVPSTSEQYQATYRSIYTEFWYENLRMQLSRPSTILPRSMQFWIWSSVQQILQSAMILAGLGHSVMHINLPSKCTDRLYTALWIQNYDLWRQRL